MCQCECLGAEQSVSSSSAKPDVPDNATAPWCVYGPAARGEGPSGLSAVRPAAAVISHLLTHLDLPYAKADGVPLVVTATCGSPSGSGPVIVKV